jgi:hypothetical protein
MISGLSEVDGRGQANKAAKSTVIIPARTVRRMSVDYGRPVMASENRLEVEILWRGN